MEQEVIFIQGITTPATAESLIWFREYYIRNNDESIDDIISTMKPEDMSTGELCNRLIGRYKLLLPDVFWELGIKITIEDVFDYSINKLIRIIQALDALKDVDMSTAVIIKDIITTEFDNITKIQMIICILDDKIEPTLPHHVITDTHGEIFKNINILMNSIIGKEEDIIPDIEINTNGSIIHMQMVTRLREIYNINNLPSIISEVLTDKYQISFIKNNTQSIIKRGVNELRLIHADNDAELFKKRLITIVMSLLVVNYISDRDTYTEETVFALKEFTELTHSDINEVNAILETSGFYNYINKGLLWD